MAARRVAELAFAILWIHFCLENCALQCWHRCSDALNHNPLRCRTICETPRRKSERSMRSRRSMANASTESPARQPTLMRCNVQYYEIFDNTNGISEPDALNIRIKYSLHQGRTIAHITWDAPAECSERPCLGYFVQWWFESSLDTANCYRTDNPNVKYFILNDTTGFNGKEPFAIYVRAYPCKNKDVSYNFNSPPKPGTLTKARTATLPKILNEETTRTSTGIQSEAQRNFSTTTTRQRTTQDSERGARKKHPPSLIVSSTLLVMLVFGMFALATRWLYRRYQHQKYLTPIHRPDYKSVIKGIHYISYLPENTTTPHVLRIYSWLTSHEIDVAMDRMYDPKLYNSLGPKRFGDKFVTKAEKVIMVITPEYLKLCWLDDAVELDTKPTLNTLDKERLYSEVTYIKNELSTAGSHARSRFVPVLLDVPQGHLPKWLTQVATVSWPKDGKSDKFLSFLKGKCSVLDERLEDDAGDANV